MKKAILIIFTAFALFLFACNNSGKKHKALSNEQLSNNLKETNTISQAAEIHPGKAVYDKYCLACHRADGNGVAGMQPPLTDKNWISDKEKLIQITLHGLYGKIEVEGKTYKSIMPPHAQLSDKDLANVLSYVRSSFGNNYDAVTVDEIKAQR